MNVDYIPRFTFEVTEAQQERAKQLLGAYGVRKAIFGPILDDVLDIIEQHGPMAIGILVSGNLKPRQVLPSMQEVERIGKLKESTDG